MQDTQQLARQLAIPLFTYLLIAAGCKKDDKQAPEAGNNFGHLTEIPADMKLLVTPKPASTGDKVTKVIGPDGGTLTSEDGDITIVVPAGAVATATSFSIQPVENTLQPGATTKSSYELLPHSVTFGKPVTIIMNYDMDAYENAADGLQVAFRDETTGGWKTLSTSLDKDEGTLTVEKNSFSIFEFFERFIVDVEKDGLDAGESTTLKVGTFLSYKAPTGTADPLPDASGELLAPLTAEFENGGIWYAPAKGGKPKISNWRILEGGGSLSAATHSYSKIYKAPSPLTQDFALVEVTLTDIPPIADKKAPGGVRHGGEMKLIAHVNLIRAWLKVTTGGVEYFLKASVTGGVAGSKTFGVGGETTIPGGGKIVASIAVVLGNGTQAKAGSYPLGTGLPGQAIVGIDLFDEDWSSQYYDCDAHTGKSSSGKVEFGQWNYSPGGQISGVTTFTANKMVDECSHITKSFKIEWVIPID